MLLAMSKPLILLTSSSKQRTQGLMRLDDVSGHNYADAVLELGGIPAAVTNNDPKFAADFIAHADGIIFSGGEDVDPEFFDAETHPDLGLVSRLRDEFELALYRAAKQKGIPILGVCRGIQLINVAEGGTLHQHVPALEGAISHGQRNIKGDNYHKVTLEPSSLLATALGKESLRTNSFHHQAVADVAAGFVATGKTADGVIEAIEHTGEHFIVGVQWHPEMNFRDDNQQLTVFKLLLDAVENARTAVV